MSDKILVSRELLERALKADASIGASAIALVDGWKAMAELRAALSAPVQQQEQKVYTTLAGKPMVCVPVDEYPAPADALVDSLYETFAKIADHLGIDAEAARKLEGKPSKVFIDAIDARSAALVEALEEILEQRMMCDTASDAKTKVASLLLCLHNIRVAAKAALAAARVK